MNFGRMAANAFGAGVGVWVAEGWVVPAIANVVGGYLKYNIHSEDYRFGVDDVIVGAVALAGAALANVAYSKVAK